MAPPNPDLLPDDLKAALTYFSLKEEASFHPYLAALEAQRPPPIFHYTRDDGLKGILSTGTFRLTDAFQLNDPTELTHGLRLLDSVLDETAKKGPPELAAFHRSMKRFVELGGVRETAHYFVGSFSLLGDDLPQWRSYADDGRGYALEFDAGKLEQAFAQPHGTFSTATFTVNYDEAEIAELYRELVRIAAPLVSLPGSRGMASADEQRSYFFDLEMRFALAALRRNIFFKHPAYSSEREYRFLQVHQAFVAKEVEFEVGKRGEETVRFRSFDWLGRVPEALTAVKVGPAAVDLPSARLQAREWLDAAGLEHVPVRDSLLPYRAFS